MGLYNRIRQRLIPDSEFHQNRYAGLLGSIFRPGLRWLDIGAGTRVHHGWIGPSNDELTRAAELVVGCDLQADHLRQNPYVTAGVLARAERLPVADASVDLVTANMLLEHLEEPLPVIREVGRVLRTGGRFAFVTPNLWNPPVLLSKTFMSATLRSRLAHRVDGRPEEHIFPTFYRMNTVRKLRGLGRNAGLDVEVLTAFFSHAFVRWPPIATVVEALAIRLTPGPVARRFGSNIVGCLVKR